MTLTPRNDEADAMKTDETEEPAQGSQANNILHFQNLSPDA